MACDYLLNEGGGEFLVLPGGQRLYELHVGEKGTTQFRLVVSGESGHASVPLRRGNAVVGAADAVRALFDYQPRLSLDTVPGEYVELLVPDPALRARLLDEGSARAALAELGGRDRRAADLLAPLYGLTFSPTIVHSSGEAVNVFPASATVTVDCRMPVGWTEDRVAAEIEAALAGVDARWEIEWLGTIAGNASPADTPLQRAITAVMARLVPGSRVVPIHSVGFTDSNWFRAAFPDVAAYNFAPFLVDDGAAVSPLFHNLDERINVRDLAFQSMFAYELVRELLRLAPGDRGRGRRVAFRGFVAPASTSRDRPLPRPCETAGSFLGRGAPFGAARGPPRVDQAAAARWAVAAPVVLEELDQRAAARTGHLEDVVGRPAAAVASGAACQRAALRGIALRGIARRVSSDAQERVGIDDLVLEHAVRLVELDLGRVVPIDLAAVSSSMAATESCRASTSLPSGAESSRASTIVIHSS